MYLFEVLLPYVIHSWSQIWKIMKKWWKTIEKITKKLRLEVLRLLEVLFKCQKLRNALHMFWEAQKYASCRQKFACLKVQGDQKRRGKSKWLLHNLKMTCRGCLGVYLDHKNGTFDYLHQVQYFFTLKHEILLFVP